MRVFVSSPVRGYEDLREAARAAIGVLGYDPVLAEDFDASAPSPRATCLAAVREADAVVLIMWMPSWMYQRAVSLKFEVTPSF